MYIPKDIPWDVKFRIFHIVLHFFERPFGYRDLLPRVERLRVLAEETIGTKRVDDPIYFRVRLYRPQEFPYLKPHAGLFQRLPLGGLKLVFPFDVGATAGQAAE